MKVKVAQLCPTLCDPMDYTVFSRPEYWNGEPFPSPGDLPNPGIEPRSPTVQADSFLFELPGKPLVPKEPTKSSSTGRISNKHLPGLEMKKKKHKSDIAYILYPDPRCWPPV